MLLLVPVHDTGRVKRIGNGAGSPQARDREEVVTLLGVEVEVVEHEIEHPHDGRSAIGVASPDHAR